MSMPVADSQSVLFGALAREATLTERVTEQIKNIIVSGSLQLGDRLPPERELARQFGVSRTVIREAVRSLTAQGLLEVRAGSGSVISNPSAKVIAESMALFLRVGRHDLDYRKILEVRRLLEVEIAGLAAERHTPQDLALLADILEENVHIGDDQDRWIQNDITFHAGLADATKNELFALMLDSMREIMVGVRRLGFTIANASERTLRYHSAIYEEVKLGNAEGARAAMRAHLIEAESTMRQALVLQQAESSVHDRKEI
jgi:GntR family transcriptional regulator, transcriptional repressor for pyruvate dehydrogenase complex